MAPTGLPVTNEQSVAFARSLAEGRNQTRVTSAVARCAGLPGFAARVEASPIAMEDSS